MKQKTPLVIIEKSDNKRKRKIASVIKRMKGPALVLVPEVVMLKEFGDIGTIYHAGLKLSEKKTIWNNVQSGDVQVVVGTQKALFLPFKKLATIVIEEEQYESYKLWDQYPRLHTVRGATALGDIFKARIVYASSYPSIVLRFLIEHAQCEQVSDNAVSLKTVIIPFAFEDRKWKRSLPNGAGTSIRAWARQGKKVLVLYNKKDNKKIQEALYFHLSAKAKQNITLGTTALLRGVMHAEYDRIVWISPEFILKAIDYRSYERARLLAARLQNITPNKPITIVTRNASLVQQVIGVSDSVWYENVIRERRALNFPPFTDVVRLTVRDKNTKKALTRADNVYAMLQDSLLNTTNIRAFGPYQEKRPKKSTNTEYHILMVGELASMVAVYQNLPIDLAEFDPHRIV